MTEQVGEIIQRLTDERDLAVQANKMNFQKYVDELNKLRAENNELKTTLLDIVHMVEIEINILTKAELKGSAAAMKQTLNKHKELLGELKGG